MNDAQTALDHLLIGSRTLDQGIEWLEAKTGVRAAIGGPHPGLGTWNALASLGSGQYIEVIAPDPSQPGIPTFYVPRLRDLTEPKIVTWAATAKAAGLAEDFVSLLPPDFACAPVRPGSRIRPDGTRIAWVLAFPKHRDHGTFGGALPFVIEWESAEVHPGRTAPAGLILRSMSLAHPNASELAVALKTLGIAEPVVHADRPVIRVEIDGPKGRIVL